MFLYSGRFRAVAASFNHANRTTVELVLDSLTAIGLLVAWDGEDGKHWK